VDWRSLLPAYFHAALATLVQLAAARAELETRKLAVNETGELDLEFLNDGPDGLQPV